MEEKTINKVAIYCRVSTQFQNIYNQKLELSQYAHERNYEFDIFEEISSTKTTRPIKQNIMTQIRLGVKYDAVIIYSFDRWARDYHELICDIKELLKHNISFISVSDNIDLSKKSGKEALKLLGAFYKFEINKISERTIQGLKRAKAEGKILGRPSGSKDKLKRSNVNYILREKKKRENKNTN